ncbi:hypothetical protein CXB51_015006 [Gossypium anomalum]|uniref:Translocon at the inner envelope membrane of chloroplasts 214 n=1 Tax=Gossypium anomalum TaxID=47600 RepID=A0A8J5YS19_9ROSI|nr:hypothetical protein CXB51_015006 [Gossypium anomalum]
MENFSHRKLILSLRSILVPRVKKIYIKTVITNYQIIDKMDFFIPQSIRIKKKSNSSNKKGSPLDWMGLNEEILI